MKKFGSYGTDLFAASRGEGLKLSFKEEKELSRRIHSGAAARKALLSGADLSDAERAEKQRLAEEGDAAYDQLVAANIPLAMKTALKTWRLNPSGLNDFEDYRQTALRAICEAAWTFDWRRGCRFSTWAWQQIMQAMIRENALTSYGLRIPEENLYRIGELKRRTEISSLDEAAAEMDLTAAAAGKLLIAAASCRSFQEPVSAEDPETELGEMITDAAALSAEEIEERIDMENEIERLMKAFSGLSEEEQTLLKGRMGFDGQVVPLKDYVGVCSKSISGVQKKQIAAEKHLRKLLQALPLAG